MAGDKEPLEALAATAEQTAKQITKQTQDYFGWLKNTMSALPWSNTMNHATQNVTATFAFVQRLSQARNFQEVVKIQTEFMNTQLNEFNDQAKLIGEI
jgi:hypothetical protein